MSSSQSDNSIYFYNPSIAAAILFTVLYSFPTAVLFWHACFRHRSFYLLCLPIAGVFETAGYAARSYSVKNVSDVGSYATSASFIVIAPLFVAAADYILLGRLMLFVLPPNNQRLLGVNPRLITRVFVGCDIASLLIQCSGTGVASSQNWVGNTGVDILIAGLATQLATNVVFMVLVAAFYKRVFVQRVVSQQAPEGWEMAFWVIVSSIVLVFIRSIYRLIEFGLGFYGYPFTHEWIFYVLESIPMLSAVTIFCFWFPGKYLPRKKPALDGGIESGKE